MKSGRTALTGRPNGLPSTWASTRASRSRKRPSACTYMLMAMSVSAPSGRMPAQSRSTSPLRGKRVRVEVLLAGATAPEPLPVHDLVEADLWDQLPTDLPELLALVPRADLYLQDEMQVTFHPTLTRVWSHRGRRGQRLVEAPGDNRHPSMALAWLTGARAGSMAGSPQDALLTCSASKCVPPWLVQSSEDEWPS